LTWYSTRVANGGNLERQQTVGLLATLSLPSPTWCHCPYPSQHLLRRTASRAVQSEHHHYPRNEQLRLQQCRSLRPGQAYSPVPRILFPPSTSHPPPFLAFTSIHPPTPHNKLGPYPCLLPSVFGFSSAPRLPLRRSVDEELRGRGPRIVGSSQAQASEGRGCCCRCRFRSGVVCACGVGCGC
jgi:hypothetical protein